MELFVLSVDPLGAGLGEHLDILAVVEKSFVPQHVKTGFTQIVDVADIPGDIEGDAASTVGYEAVLIDDGDFRTGFQAFESAGGFGAKRDAAYDEYLLIH
jgi:hypothetical protein